MRAEGVEKRRRPALLRPDDQKIRQRPRPGVELAEAQEGGLGEGGQTAAGGEAGFVDG